MRRRFLATVASTGAVVIGGVLFGTIPVIGQTAAKATPNATAKAAPKTAARTVVPKTPWGDPNLQGVYTFSTLTPLQRPNALTGKEKLTEAELAEQEERDAENRVNEDRPLRPGDTGTYNNFWTSNEKGR